MIADCFGTHVIVGHSERRTDHRETDATVKAKAEAGLAEVRARHREVEDLQADLDQSVRRLAEQVRATVQGRSADLRAELKAAAREARTTARPATAFVPA